VDGVRHPQHTQHTNACLTRLCYTFHSYTFLLTLLLHGYTTFNKNIIQDLPPKWIINSLEVYNISCNVSFVPIFSQVSDQCRIDDQ
jgi:hypothetical protein